MRFTRTETLLPAILCLGILAAPCGNALASAGSCTYPKPDAGIGGTGNSGTGMGGTGSIAKGTGIGGTGATPELGTGEMRVAGNVISSQGNVEAHSNGRSRLLAKNDAICVGETIVTGPSGTVQLRMADLAQISVLAQTQLKIDKYVFGGTRKDTSQLALLKGTGRFITGAIGKAYPQNDLIQTPSATIGVRGTDHEATVILPNEKADFPPGTYDKVNSGITFIRTQKGEVEIHRNEAGYAASPEESPVLLKTLPDFHRLNPSANSESGSSKDAHSKEGSGESSKEHKAVDGTKPESPEPAATSGEHGIEDASHHMALPEHPEIPEHPALPEIPEHPEVPGTPERPEAPISPERPDSPAQPDY